MELLYRFEATLDQPAPIGPVTEGLRIDYPFRGRVIDGPFAGGAGWGVDYLTIRADGVGVVDARDTFEVAGGLLHAHARGYVTGGDGRRMPPIEEMLAPDFVPEDAPFDITAFALCQTGVPGLEVLNRTVVAVTGSVNMFTGALLLEGRADVGLRTTAPVVAGPAG